MGILSALRYNIHINISQKTRHHGQGPWGGRGGGALDQEKLQLITLKPKKK